MKNVSLILLVAAVLLGAFVLLRSGEKKEPLPEGATVATGEAKVAAPVPEQPAEGDAKVPVEKLMAAALQELKHRPNLVALKEAQCSEQSLQEAAVAEQDTRYVGWAKNKASVQFVMEKYPELADKLRNADDPGTLFVAYKVAALGGLPGEDPALLRERAIEKGSEAAKADKLEEANDQAGLMALAKENKVEAALALARLSAQAQRVMWFCRAGELGDAEGKYQCGMALVTNDAGRERARAMLTDAAGLGVADAARVLSEHFAAMAKVGEDDAAKFSAYWRCKAYVLGSPGF